MISGSDLSPETAGKIARALGVDILDIIETEINMLGGVEMIGKEKNMVCGKVKAIISAMCASCLSPQEIDDKAGVSVNIVYRMRKGYMVKLERFERVCKALCIELDDVIDYERMKNFKENKAEDNQR